MAREAPAMTLHLYMQPGACIRASTRRRPLILAAINGTGVAAAAVPHEGDRLAAPARRDGSDLVASGSEESQVRQPPGLSQRAARRGSTPPLVHSRADTTFRRRSEC